MLSIVTVSTDLSTTRSTVEPSIGTESTDVVDRQSMVRQSTTDLVPLVQHQDHIIFTAPFYGAVIAIAQAQVPDLIFFTPAPATAALAAARSLEISKPTLAAASPIEISEPALPTAAQPVPVSVQSATVTSEVSAIAGAAVPASVPAVADRRHQDEFEQAFEMSSSETSDRVKTMAWLLNARLSGR